MHEIVTIQLGRRANYLCTHYWNTQESYQTLPSSCVDHDVHFRQGIALDGTETYLPRTLIYDLSTGFGSLAHTNVLGSVDAEDNAADQLWEGSLTRLPSALQPEPSPYMRSLLASLDPVLPTISTTPFFADFASTFYHPRSLIPITPPYPSNPSAGQQGPTGFSASGTAQSSSFEAGVDLFAARDADVDVLDTDTRLWLEECDSLQAVQVFTSSDDAWAGFATRYVERLRDELGKSCIWVWGIDATVTAHEPGQPPKTNAQKREQSINSSMTVHRLADQASMYVPLSIPDVLPQDVTIDRRSLWHTSALLEAAVETSTLPTRLRDISHTMHYWQDILSSSGLRTISQLAMSPNFDVPKASQDTRMRSAIDDVGIFQKTGAQLSRINFGPSSSGSSIRIGERLRQEAFSKLESYRAPQAVLDYLQAHEAEPGESDVIDSFWVPLAMQILPTYPRIFANEEARAVDSIRVQTSLATSSRVARWVRGLQGNLRSGSGTTVGGEEREAVYSSLGDIADKYIEGWDSAGESDDDD